jgi:hypothetical protein
MLIHQNHAAREENGSIVVGMFVCLCLASKKPSEREFFVPALAGKVADMSAICRPDSQKSVLLADSAKSCRHKFFPDTFFCVGDCRLSPNFL